MDIALTRGRTLRRCIPTVLLTLTTCSVQLKLPLNHSGYTEVVSLRRCFSKERAVAKPLNKPPKATNIKPAQASTVFYNSIANFSRRIFLKASVIS